MLLGNGLLPMFAVGGGMIWNGSTWAIDGSGRAYNVPMLGAELMINPGFDSDTAWTKDTGWTIASGVATKTTGSASWIRQATATAGRYHRLIFDLTAISVGAMQASIGGFAIGPVRSSIGAGYSRDHHLPASTRKQQLIGFAGAIYRPPPGPFERLTQRTAPLKIGHRHEDCVPLHSSALPHLC